MGSYPAWDRIARAICLWLGVGDPCGGRDDVRSEADPERDLLRQFLTVAGDHMGIGREDTWTVGEIITKSAVAAPLRDVLIAMQPYRQGEQLDSKAIGYKLRGWKQRPLSLRDAHGGAVWDRRLVRCEEKRQGANTWRIEEREVRHA